MKKILYIGLLGMLITACADASESGKAGTNQEVSGGRFESVSKKDFKAFLENTEGVQLVDVRTPEEYAGGFIEGAKNIDFNSPEFTDKIQGLDKSKPVMIYCEAGGRSAKALEQMKSMGFTTVLELEGGYSGWNY